MMNYRSGKYKLAQEHSPYHSDWIVTILWDKEYIPHSLGTWFSTQQAALDYMNTAYPNVERMNTKHFNILCSNLKRLPRLNLIP